MFPDRPSAIEEPALEAHPSTGRIRRSVLPLLEQAVSTSTVVIASAPILAGFMSTVPPQSPPALMASAAGPVTRPMPMGRPASATDTRHLPGSHPHQTVDLRQDSRCAWPR